jgi:glycosyltransferase involved in cell wall biosynthesis
VSIARTGRAGPGAARPLFVVLPGNVDDPATPSGGNRYDRAVCDRLARSREVHEIAVNGDWPRPSTIARAAVAGALDGLPDGSTVLLDGLAACGIPEVLEPAADRLRLVVLVHLPLGDETGLSPAEAAELTARERRTLHAAAAVVVTSDGAARRVIELHALPPAKVHVAVPGVDPAPLAPGSATGPESDTASGSATGLESATASGSTADDATAHSATADDATADDATADDATADDATADDATADSAAARDGRPGPALLCVAAVSPRKGQDVLVEALRTVEDLDWSCTCVGSTARGVPAGPGRVRFAGPRTGADLDAAYAAADLLVLPSRAETYGMVVTEALARGIPVLGTRVDGVPEALGAAPDGTVPGTLVPPGDPAALAAAIRAWLTDADLRRRWRAAARARRDTLPGWNDTAGRLAAVLDPGDDKHDR